MTTERHPDDAALLAESRRARRELPDAPEWLVLRAEAIADRAAQPVPRPSLRQRVQSLLSLDSWGAAPVPMLRSGGGIVERQLLFTADQGDVDLRMVHDGTAWALHGQVLAPDDGGSVELAGPAPTDTRQQVLDPLGCFRLVGLAPGEYRLTLSLTDCELELPPLNLPDPTEHG